MPALGDICERVVKSHKDITIAVILDKEDAIDFYVRPDAPVPDDFRTENMIAQVQLIVSTIKQSQDYLGDLSLVHIHMGRADALLVPLGIAKVLVAIVKPQAIEGVAKHVLESVK